MSKTYMPIDKIDVTYRRPEDLRPDKRNARSHPKAQIEQISASIREFGFTNPILVDPSGTVIAGHGRLLAAKSIGLEQVPTIQLSNLSEAQTRALRIADNKIALGASWNLELLEMELRELSKIDIDLSLTGFSVGEIDVLLKDENDPEAEFIPAVPRAGRVRLGDIWQLGEHRVGCGDATDAAFLRKVVGPEAKVDAGFFDPPYNVKIGGHVTTKKRHREFAMASGEMTTEGFQRFLRTSLGNAAAISRDGAVHFVCMDWRHVEDVIIAGKGVYGTHLNLCVWNKSNAGMGSLYRSKHEIVFVFRVGTAAPLNAVELGRHGRNRTNVWDFPSVNTFGGSRPADLALHPTVKPLGLVAEAIQDVTRRGDLVLDSFLGSGTTLIASERTGRRLRGIEIDPGYLDVSIERWTSMTGEEPTLIEGGDR